MKTASMPRLFVTLTSLVIVIFFLFLWLSSINEAFEEGEAFGFFIGANKIETLASLRDKPRKRIEQIQLVYENKYSKNVTLSSTQEDFTSSEKWIVMYDSVYFFDSTTLEFCEEKLCKIWRKRQYFEIP